MQGNIVSSVLSISSVDDAQISFLESCIKQVALHYIIERLLSQTLHCQKLSAKYGRPFVVGRRLAVHISCVQLCYSIFSEIIFRNIHCINIIIYIGVYFV